ncbi:hypothetical protein PYCC9005_000814 [Savitreella phatthalungensis]
MDPFTVTSRVNGRIEEISIPLHDNSAPAQHAQNQSRAAYTRRRVHRHDGGGIFEFASSSDFNSREGSRRRRRSENAQLLGCPARVDPSPEDWDIRATHQHKRQVISWERALEIDPTALRSKFTHDRKSVGTSADGSAPQTPRLSRALRHELKRQHASPAFVQSIEQDVRDVLCPQDAEAEYDVVDPISHGADDSGIELAADDSAPTHETRLDRQQASHTVRIAIQAPNERATAYLRYFVHLICQYYGLESASKDFGSSRYACVQLRPTFKLPEVWFCQLL